MCATQMQGGTFFLAVLSSSPNFRTHRTSHADIQSGMSGCHGRYVCANIHNFSLRDSLTAGQIQPQADSSEHTQRTFPQLLLSSRSCSLTSSFLPPSNSCALPAFLLLRSMKTRTQQIHAGTSAFAMRASRSARAVTRSCLGSISWCSYRVAMCSATLHIQASAP